MAYVGNWNAILQSQGGGISGRVAWILWRSAYLVKSLSWRNKILIPIYWYVRLLLEFIKQGPLTVVTLQGHQLGVRQRHFEILSDTTLVANAWLAEHWDFLSFGLEAKRCASHAQQLARQYQNCDLLLRTVRESNLRDMRCFRVRPLCGWRSAREYQSCGHEAQFVAVPLESCMSRCKYACKHFLLSRMGKNGD